VGPLLVMWAQPQDLHHHGTQHGQVEQKHQAEEAKVGDVADQGVTDPAPGGGCEGSGVARLQQHVPCCHHVCFHDCSLSVVSAACFPFLVLILVF
jgi:hypothetical protein